MSEVWVDLDILTWALERVGDDGADGCQFESMGSVGPDHHGREFATALFAAIEEELREFELLRGANKR